MSAVQEQTVNENKRETLFLSLITQTNGTTTINDELINKIHIEEYEANDSRHLIHLIIIIIVCLLMFTLTIIGNLIVILAISLVQKLKTTSNILIFNLAVNDLVVGLFIMPVALILEISNEWILGSVMCDLWTSIDVLLCISSVLITLIIVIHRYCIIKYPFKYTSMHKIKFLIFMMASVWIVSALFSLPPILGWGRPSDSLPICQVNPKLADQIFSILVGFYTPTIAMLIIYVKTYRIVVNRRSSFQMSPFLTHNTTSANVEQASRNEQAVRILGVMVGLLIICWSPFML
ncbi:unnamed protein product, partial [Rotaria sp. Silwood1]